MNTRWVMAGCILLLFTGCGSCTARSPASPTPKVATATLSPIESPSPIQSPSPVPSGSSAPTEIRDCPQTVTSLSGHYSITCPQGWKYLNCEATGNTAPYTWLINPTDPCRQESYGARLLVISFAGSHDPAGFLGTLQSTDAVVVDGVKGTRRAYLVTVSNPLPPSKDTVQVLYTFLTGGRTYYLGYDRYPGDADRTAAFDDMVTRTLKLST